MQSSRLSFKNNIFNRNNKEDICLDGASKENALYSIRYASKNASMPPVSRIGPDALLSLRLEQESC